MKAMEVTAGLVESNGSLPPGGWLKATCGLTACTPGSALGPMLGNEYGKTLLLYLIDSYLIISSRVFTMTERELACFNV